MEVVYANCFGAPERDVLITDEPGVARAASGGVATVLADERYDPDVAQTVNRQLGELAYSWASLGGPDPTLCDGVAAADLAGNEALLTLLLPAARGVLDARATLESPSGVTVAVPQTSDPRFDRVERVIGEGFAAAAGLHVDWATVADPRTDALVAKYAQTRNPAFRPRETAGAHALAAVTAWSVNVLSRMRGRGPVRVLVVDYHPTAAFARVYRACGGGPFGLVRLRFGSPDVATMIRAGDRALAPLGGPGVARRDAGVEQALTAYVERHRDDLRARFTVAGVDLWQVVGERLMEMALDYAGWMQPRLGRVRRALLVGRVGAVLVPFEGPPEARLVLKVAQALEIPTLIINDGWKGDDHQQDGMAADRALAWSSSIAHNYYGRRRHGHPTVITGNPRNDEARRRSPGVPPSPGDSLRRVLVGSFTFSPSDLNCRRSDPERFLAEVLEGIAASRRARGAHVVVKLHPADRPQSYQAVLERLAELDLEVRQGGDVLDLFGEVDAYITTYSTSLLEAAAFGLPVVYYRVNRQRLNAPFSDDDVMAARTASSSQELAALLDDADRLALPDGDLVASWVQHHLGPTDGQCSERVAAALIADVRGGPRRGPAEAVSANRHTFTTESAG
jgi:hypothetical protein